MRHSFECLFSKENVESKVFCMICRLRCYSVTYGSSGKGAAADLHQLQLLGWPGKVETMWLKYASHAFPPVWCILYWQAPQI
jgi:hypothetical protein